MAIKPLDLQVLFSRLDQIGKEQAVGRDASVNQQFQQGADIVKRSEQQNNSVNQLHTVERDGIQKLKKEEKRHKRRQSGAGSKARSHDAEDVEVVSDPRLGRRIDLIG